MVQNSQPLTKPPQLVTRLHLGVRCHHPLRLCLAKTTRVTHWWSQKSQKQPKKKNTCSLCFPNMFFFSKNNDFWFTNWSYASPQTPKCSYPGANPRRQRGEHHGPVDHLEDRELQPWWPKFRRGGKIVGKRRALYEGSVVTWFPKPAGLFLVCFMGTCSREPCTCSWESCLATRGNNSLQANWKVRSS